MGGGAVGKLGGARLWTSLGPTLSLGAQSLGDWTAESVTVGHPQGPCMTQLGRGEDPLQVLGGVRPGWERSFF